jgi:hypothetical protein
MGQASFPASRAGRSAGLSTRNAPAVVPTVGGLADARESHPSTHRHSQTPLPSRPYSDRNLHTVSMLYSRDPRQTESITLAAAPCATIAFNLIVPASDHKYPKRSKDVRR